jgi:hypothetical protein
MGVRVDVALELGAAQPLASWAITAGVPGASGVRYALRTAPPDDANNAGVPYDFCAISCSKRQPQ